MIKGTIDSTPLILGTPQKEAEATLKQAFTEVPALRLPDPEKAFQIYVHEKERIALEVLTQSWDLSPSQFLTYPRGPTQLPKAGLPAFKILQLLQF